MGESMTMYSLTAMNFRNQVDSGISIDRMEKITKVVRIKVWTSRSARYSYF